MSTIKPADLPEFGAVDGNFIPQEWMKILVPKNADPNGPIEQLETPDQLEERENIKKQKNIKEDDN